MELLYYIIIGIYSALIINNFLILFFYYKNWHLPRNTFQNKFIVCIPCHDDFEDLDILLDNLSLQEYDSNLINVIVVLDNCSTNYIDKNKCNIVIIERNDKEKIGKLYALQYVTEYILNRELNNEYIIYIDCDVRLKKDFFAKLNESLIDSNFVIQPDFEIFSTSNNFSFRIKYLKFRYQLINNISRSKIGIYNNLNGPLQCIPANIVKRNYWKILCDKGIIFNEDMSLGFTLAINNIKIRTLKEVNCFVKESSTLNNDFRKYNRWYSGKIKRIKGFAPDLFYSLLKKPTFYKLTSLFELLSPSTSSMFFITIMLTIILILNLNFYLLSIWCIIIVLYFIPMIIYTRLFTTLKVQDLLIGIFYILLIRINSIIKTRTYKNSKW